MRPEAQQLIYGRIEAEHKKSGPSGLQTLWFSEQLSVSAIKEIEAAIRCFDIEQKSRIQFARLSDGRFFVSQTRLSSGDDVIDRQRRRAFICRVLVVSDAALGRFEDHPFLLVAANPFTDDVPDLLARYGAPPCVVPLLPLHCAPAGLPEDIPSPPGDEVRRALLTAGLAGEELRRARRLVFLRGDDAEARQAIHWLFDRIPRRSRRACSFTTQTDKCRPRPELFSLSAGTTLPALRITQKLLLRESRVKGRFPIEVQVASEIFLEAMALLGYVPPSSLEELDLLCEFLAGKDTAKPPRLEGEILRTIVDSQQNRLATRIDKLLALLIGKRLAKGLRAHLLANLDAWVASSIVQALVIDSQEAVEALVLDALQSWLGERDPAIGWWTRRRLCKLATRHGRKVLLHWLSIYSSSRWKTANAESMSDDELQTACLRLGRMPIADLVCRRHLETLIEKLQLVEMTEKELANFLQRIDRLGSALDLSRLEEKISELEPRSLRKLEGMNWRNRQLIQLIGRVAKRRSEMGEEV